MVRLRETKKNMGIWGQQNSKMASFIPWLEKKLMDVELGKLPNWMLMWDFTSKGLGYVREVTAGITTCALM